MSDSRKCIVIGGNHHNTLGVIRSLGRKGIMSDVIITRNNVSSFVLKSKYINKGWMVDGSKEAIELLLSEYADNNERIVVIACHDGISSLIDLNRDKLLPYFIIPGAETQGKVTELMNKRAMGTLASKNGLIVPKTWVLNDATLQETPELFFPCITKPIESCRGDKGEIKVCKDKGQLDAFLRKSEGKEFLVQQFIEKDFEFQLIGCSLRSGEDIIIPGISIILRQPSNTNTGFLHYKAFDESYIQTIEKTKSFIKETGYSGLFSVEFLRDKQGEDYFMEINFRNDGNSIAVTNAGVNLPYIWYLACNNLDYREEIKPIHDEFVMPEFAEMILYIYGSITLAEWKKDMKKATSYMDYDANDPAPTNGWKDYNNQKRLACLKRAAIKILKRH